KTFGVSLLLKTEIINFQYVAKSQTPKVSYCLAKEVHI
ncbi:MAG: hypothetical protein ACI95T_001310, partial [Flavobacteriales bacterium]